MVPDSGTAFSLEDEAMEYSLGLRLDELIESSTLDDREKVVIDLRFGLESGQGMTLEEVGRILGLTRERIRQIEAKVLEKLRRAIWHQSLYKDFAEYFSADNPTSPASGLLAYLPIDDYDEVALGLERAEPYGQYRKRAEKTQDSKQSAKKTSYTLKEYGELKAEAPTQ